MIDDWHPTIDPEEIWKFRPLDNKDGGWHVGQSYEEEPAKSLVCKICGSTSFEVGQGNHFTAVRCPNCKYEMCIHTG